MEVDKNLLKELEKELKRDKILRFIKIYKKHIAYVVISIFVGFSIYGSYIFYIKNKADKNSVVFSEVKESMANGDMDKALSLLDSLIKDGTNGYVFISYMEKANILLSQGKQNEAINVLKEASKEVSLPSYYNNMIKSIEFMNRLNNNEGEDLEVLEKDIKASLNEKDPFYFYNLEMYASLLFMKKQYDLSLKTYQTIINSSNSSSDVRDRAKRAKSLLVTYNK